MWFMARGIVYPRGGFCDACVVMRRGRGPLLTITGWVGRGGGGVLLAQCCGLCSRPIRIEGVSFCLNAVML